MLLCPPLQEEEYGDDPFIANGTEIRAGDPPPIREGACETILPCGAGYPACQRPEKAAPQRGKGKGIPVSLKLADLNTAI